MENKIIIGYVFSYTDTGESCDSYPRISKLYTSKEECIQDMKEDAEQYARGDIKNGEDHGGEIKYLGDCIEVEFSCNTYCLYKIHEVYKYGQ